MALLPLFFLLLSASGLASSDISPSPAPILAPPPDFHSPFSAPSPGSRSPSLSSSPSSAPTPTPTPNPFSPPAPPMPGPTPSVSPSPVPAPVNELIHANGADGEHAEMTADEERNGMGKGKGGGLSGGQKVGVAIGVVAVVALVCLGAVVYRKRQQNIRRASYGGYGTRHVEMI